jgi:hypothetical protein
MAVVWSDAVANVGHAANGPPTAALVYKTLCALDFIKRHINGGSPNAGSLVTHLETTNDELQHSGRSLLALDAG